MPIRVDYHSAVVPKLTAWRRTLPGVRADRDGLTAHYVEIVAREAVRQAKSTRPPWVFTIDFVGKWKLKVAVKKERAGYEVLILDLL